MKTKTWILLLGTVLALCLGLSVFLFLPDSAATHAEVRSNGEVLRTVNLNQDQTFTVDSETGGRNTVTVQNGKIAVTEASCPDHHCMNRGYCASGSPIVCLPNRLVITFVTPQDVDFVVG